MSGSSSANGLLSPDSGQNAFNAQSFLIAQTLARANTATLVKVIAVTNSGGVEPVGFCDIQPMVHQVDGIGTAVPHGTIYGVPYSRVQGGVNAVILDPEPGDIGIAVFASRDISVVKSSKKPSQPGSARRMDFSDAIYIGWCLNAVPQQFVQFSTSGINIVSPTKITLTAPEIDIGGNGTNQIVLTTSSGSNQVVINTVQTLTNGALKNNSHDVGSTHHHLGVQTGGGITGIPQ